jgi:NAD(P)-dependent dehydrogenase (short-subunit alcohol dehydrogenase family)
MSRKLKGSVCLVTGASRGIGAAIAEMLADHGAKLAVHYGSNRTAAEEVADRIAGTGHIVIGADLSDPAAAAAIVDETIAAFGRLDVLVNNAGIFESHPPLKSSGDEWLRAWQHVLAVNLLSPAALCQAAAKVMASQGGGRIVNVGSRGAFRGEPDCPAYGASKAGLHSMSQSLAIALGPSNIQVFAVAPGFVETDMAKALLDSDAGEAVRCQSPMNRVARPEEVAEVVCFLASTDAEFMTGGIIDINGASYLRT